MASFPLDDLASKLQTDGVGTIGTDLFKSSASAPPQGTSVVIVETGGTSPDNTHNAVTAPAYRNPGFQITARAATYTIAQTKALAAYTSLVAIRNETLGSNFYQRVRPLGELIDLGRDDKGLFRVAFNVLATYNKRA